MELSAGGTAQARAVLKAQLDAVEIEMALERTRVGKISAGLMECYEYHIAIEGEGRW